MKKLAPQFILSIPLLIFLAANFVDAGMTNSSNAMISSESDSSQAGSSESGLAAIPLISGKGMQLTGYTQFRLQFLQPDAEKNSGADIRRIRLILDGELAKGWQYRLQADLASSPKAVDAYVRYSPFDFFKVTAGQFKIPFSEENLASSGKLEFIDRSQVVEALCARSNDVIGNENGRDIGVQLGGSAIKLDSADLIEYYAGLFNGSGINSTDNNNAKDFCGRVVLHAFAGLSIGGSYYDGYDQWGVPSASHGRSRRGLEFRYEYRALTLAGEYIAGNDADTKKDGSYAQATCFLIPNLLQIVARYDTYNPDQSKSDQTATNYVFGMNYYSNSSVMIQVNYLLRREDGTQKKNDVVEIQLQYGL